MRLIRRRTAHGASGDDNPYWISFSDIMSGLLIIFILASLALILELTKTRTEVTDAIREIIKAEQVRRQILDEIVDELRKRNIEVEVSENHTVLRIPENVLYFSSNEYRIPDDQRVREVVKEIGLFLYKAITKDKRWQYLDTIFIEGHTDRRPSPRIMGNWGLSTFRAISIWKFWNEELPPDKRLDTLKNHSGAPLFSVSGYADTRPIQAQQVTEEDFRKNRRIDIRFTIRRPDIQEYETVKKLLDE
jgi:flagellar motor protein MotB